MVLRFYSGFLLSIFALTATAAEVKDVDGKKIYDSIRMIQKIDISFRAAESCRMLSNVVSEVARQRDSGKKLEEILLKLKSNEEAKAEAQKVYESHDGPMVLSDKVYFECQVKARKMVLEDVQI